jgi:hypothetical protein
MNQGNSSVLLPTAYLPPVFYLACLLHFDEVYIEQHETYPKQSYRNRCEILTANGKLTLTVPVQKPDGNRTKTNVVEVFSGSRWQINHWRAIESAYLSSPFFLYYQDAFKPFYEESFENLMNLNRKLVQAILEILDIEKTINLTEDFEKQPQGVLDLRTSIHPKRPLEVQFFPDYTQVFSDRHGFSPNLSIIDLLFNLGPESKDYLRRLDIKKVLS